MTRALQTAAERTTSNMKNQTMPKKDKGKGQEKEKRKNEEQARQYYTVNKQHPAFSEFSSKSWSKLNDKQQGLVACCMDVKSGNQQTISSMFGHSSKRRRLDSDSQAVKLPGDAVSAPASSVKSVVKSVDVIDLLDSDDDEGGAPKSAADGVAAAGELVEMSDEAPAIKADGKSAPSEEAHAIVAGSSLSSSDDGVSPAIETAYEETASSSNDLMPAASATAGVAAMPFEIINLSSDTSSGGDSGDENALETETALVAGTIDDLANEDVNDRTTSATKSDDESMPAIDGLLVGSMVEGTSARKLPAASPSSALKLASSDGEEPSEKLAESLSRASLDDEKEEMSSAIDDATMVVSIKKSLSSLRGVLAVSVEPSPFCPALFTIEVIVGERDTCTPSLLRHVPIVDRLKRAGLLEGRTYSICVLKQREMESVRRCVDEIDQRIAAQ